MTNRVYMFSALEVRLNKSFGLAARRGEFVRLPVS